MSLPLDSLLSYDEDYEDEDQNHITSTAGVQFPPITPLIESCFLE